MTPDSGEAARLVSSLVHSPGMKECLNWFSREKQWVNDQHLQLCRIAAPTFFEQERAKWMLAAFSISRLRAHASIAPAMSSRSCSRLPTVPS